MIFPIKTNFRQGKVKVVYTAAGGYDHQIVEADAILERGKEYDIAKIEMYASNTDYTLYGFEGQKFNSVLFEVVQG